MLDVRFIRVNPKLVEEKAEKRDEKQGQKIKAKLKSKEDKLEKLQEEFYFLIRQVPNMPLDNVPVGKDESANKVVRQIGKITKLDFEPKDHLKLGEALDLIDVQKASIISGPRFSFLKNELVTLEFALVNFALDTLKAKGFIQIIPPVVVNKKAVEGLGYPEYERGEG